LTSAVDASVSADSLRAIQGLVARGGDPDVFSRCPSLPGVAALNPSSEAARQAVAAMTRYLPSDFEARAEVALAKPGYPQYEIAALNTLLGDAYARALPDVEKLVGNRARELERAVREGRMDLGELGTAAFELSAFQFYGPTVQKDIESVHQMAATERALSIYLAARKAAEQLRLEKNPGPMDGAGGVSPDAARRASLSLGLAQLQRPGAFQDPVPSRPAVDSYVAPAKAAKSLQVAVSSFIFAGVLQLMTIAGALVPSGSPWLTPLNLSLALVATGLGALSFANLVARSARKADTSRDGHK
jgi:hypothetical protein